MMCIRVIHHLLIYLSLSEFYQSSSDIKRLQDLDGSSYYDELMGTRRTREIKSFDFNWRELYHRGNCPSPTLLIITVFKKKFDIELIAISLT